jgi:hypothetical protein
MFLLELFLMGEVPEHWLGIFIHALCVNTSHLPNDVIHFNYELSPFDVITSLVSLVYWGFHGEKVTSQGDA